MYKNQIEEIIMKNKVIILVATLAMFFFASCGKNSDEGSAQVGESVLTVKNPVKAADDGAAQTGTETPTTK
jgi:hypothetical protein